MYTLWYTLIYPGGVYTRLYLPGTIAQVSLPGTIAQVSLPVPWWVCRTLYHGGYAARCTMVGGVL